MIAKVQCEICMEIIASIDTDTMSYPLTGNQFISPDELHGYLPPFPKNATWEEMRCPHCNYRPFTTENYVKTENGLIEAKYPEPEELTDEQNFEEQLIAIKDNQFVCPHCGKVCTRQYYLDNHIKQKHKDVI